MDTPHKSTDYDEISEKISTIQDEVSYDMRDFTIGYLIQEFQAKNIYIPEYQRKFIWPNQNRANFIESVILGLPVPFMFLADDKEGKLEIVDGAQRMQTLEQFLSDHLLLSGLKKMPFLNKLKFSDLPLSQQRKLRFKALRMIILEDKTTIETRREIFNRINTSSIAARPVEVWRGSIDGELMEKMKTCAEHPIFRELCPMTDKKIDRGEDLELVARFFVFSNNREDFKHDVANYLEAFIRKHKDDVILAERTEKAFLNMLYFVKKFFPHGFAKHKFDKTTPRVRYEAISLGTDLALRQNKHLIPSNLDWLKSEEFKIHTTTHASNSAPRLEDRINYVKEQLLAGNK